MNDFPFLLIERTMSEMKSPHWPFKGSWHKSGQRGVKKAQQHRWLRKAKKIVVVPERLGPEE